MLELLTLKQLDPQHYAEQNLPALVAEVAGESGRAARTPTPQPLARHGDGCL